MFGMYIYSIKTVCFLIRNEITFDAGLESCSCSRNRIALPEKYGRHGGRATKQNQRKGGTDFEFSFCFSILT